MQVLYYRLKLHRAAEEEVEHTVAPDGGLPSLSSTSTPSSSMDNPMACDSSPPAKKSKQIKNDTTKLEEAILENLKGLRERRESLSLEDELFGCQIASTLHRLDPRKKAMAKMQIQQLLFSVEFGDQPGPCNP